MPEGSKEEEELKERHVFASSHGDTICVSFTFYIFKNEEMRQKNKEGCYNELTGIQYYIKAKERGKTSPMSSTINPFQLQFPGRLYSTIKMENRPQKALSGC